MKEIKNNLTMSDTIAGILLTTAVEEYNKKQIDLPIIDNNGTYIREEQLDNKVRYSLMGNLGDYINNPDIVFRYTDTFNNDSKPSIGELNDTFIKLYVTLYLINKSNK